MEKLNTDIYDITTMVTELEQKYIDDEDPETLAAGIFGYFADVHSLILQNSIISTSELGNELFPARAKYERNLLSHGVTNNIDYINELNLQIGAYVFVEKGGAVIPKVTGVDYEKCVLEDIELES